MSSPATPASAAAVEGGGEQQQQHAADPPLVLYDAVWIRRHADLRTESYWEGIVEYLGSVDFAIGQDWVGVRLTGASAGLGKNNGTVQGRCYFDAPPNCGLFVRQSSGVVQRRSLTKREEVRLRRDLGIAVSPSSRTVTTMATTTPTASRGSTTTIMTTTTTLTSTTPTAIAKSPSSSQTKPSFVPKSALKVTVANGKIAVR
jgi:CAP-Gly domain